MPKKPTFENSISIIDGIIEKRRGKWRLFAISWMDFDDVAQELRIHIHKKWHLWDNSKPLEPWLNQVINHQMINKTRNHYSSFAKPCVQCVHKDGEDGCYYTMSKKQCNECPLYSEWSKKKKRAYDVKLPVSMENHQNEMNERSEYYGNIDKQIESLKIKIKCRLTDTEYKIFIMLYIQHLEEADVAEKMGFKTSEKRRKAGYRQIINYKKSIIKKAKKLLEEEDIDHV